MIYNAMAKYFFFDMDGTITESRQRISPEMATLLDKIPHVIISGATLSQMRKQVGDRFLMPISGNELWNGEYIWRDKLPFNTRRAIYRHIRALNPEYTQDQVEDRGGQISYSLIGHNAPQELKKSFDPKGNIRRKLLSKIKGVEMRIGGTTNIDYSQKGKNKGSNIKRFLKEYGINPKDCVYFGDALYKNGNDESVIGIIKTIKVKNPKETLTILKNIL